MSNPFVDSINKAINRSGLSNADIERASGVDRSVVGRILSGERIPTQNTLERITNVLKRLEDSEMRLTDEDIVRIEQYRKAAQRLRDQQTRSTDELPIMQKRSVEAKA